MQDEKNTVNKTPDVLKLSNELMYRRYLLNKDQLRNFFKELSIPDYIALHIIQETEELTEIYEGRTYLKDLAEKMQMTIRQTSKMVGNLRDRGLLLWSHDGNGSEGTYVTITESGKKLLKNQEQILRDYYGKVIEKYGKENLIQLLRLMKELETVMSSELERMEDACEERDDE
ncbi:MAG: MarR family transcriptional regulator [Oliverpabstia sp.]|mgnify:FL=1|nr:MarR family transcriptional regulator [Lachnospiraceae bacterium]MDY5025718.1 MarR family transcriptional regulator [Oliverpabstia sp.]